MFRVGGTAAGRHTVHVWQGVPLVRRRLVLLSAPHDRTVRTPDRTEIQSLFSGLIVWHNTQPMVQEQSRARAEVSHPEAKVGPLKRIIHLEITLKSWKE